MQSTGQHMTDLSKPQITNILHLFYLFNNSTLVLWIVYVMML